MIKRNLPNYDVVVIGAGSIGTPVAFSMAHNGLRTLVLESRASPGQGSNKAAIGGIRATHSDPAKVRLCLRSLEVFSTWKEIYGDDIEWYKGGYTFVNLRVRRTWRGLYPMTPDGYPIIGWSREVDGFLAAAGMCGQGFMLGPGVGELVARMVLQQTTASDQEILEVVSPYREFVGHEKLK